MAGKPHAEIAGGGFAGLVSAIALSQRGWSVRVHERDPALRAFGAGIFIWENGLRVLEAIGACDDVIAGSHEAGVYEVRDGDRTISKSVFAGGNGGRMLTMTRQTLYAAILKVAEKEGVDFALNSEIAGASPDGALHTAAGRRLAADLAIGADGVRSRVRDSLGLQKERDVGAFGLLRVLAPRCLDRLGAGPWHHVIDYWNLAYRSLRVLYVPCNAEELYLALMAPVDDREATALPVRADIWAPGFPQLEPVLREASPDGRFDAYETAKLTRWSVGRVAIVGDSAHAMVPSLGQGAGLAIMNGLALAVAVERAPTIEEGLARWERRERPLTEYTQDWSARAARERMTTQGRIWREETLRTARAIPTGTERLPRPLVRRAWGGRGDSNPRPPGPQPGALTD